MKHPKTPRYPGRAQRDKCDAANLAAARVILGAPEKHSRFMREWAERCLARLDEERTGQRALFPIGGSSEERKPDERQRNGN